MSRRARAIGFASAALACAALAAAVAGGYRTDLEGQLGPLRRVVVTRDEALADPAIASGRCIEAARGPPDPGAVCAAGGGHARRSRRSAARRRRAIPAGAYVLASQLRSPAPATANAAGRGSTRAASRSRSRSPGPRPWRPRGGDPRGSRVDVIVTTEPGPGGADGRTYVAAEGVELLALGESGDPGAGDGLPGSAPGGLDGDPGACSRPQALRLIQAENFARQVRLIPH